MKGSQNTTPSYCPLAKEGLWTVAPLHPPRFNQEQSGVGTEERVRLWEPPVWRVAGTPSSRWPICRRCRASCQHSCVCSYVSISFLVLSTYSALASWGTGEDSHTENILKPVSPTLEADPKQSLRDSLSPGRGRGVRKERRKVM